MGRQATDLTGQQFNNLIVLKRDYDNADKKHAYWLCQCNNCGKIKSVRGTHLTSGAIKSCACIRPTRIHDLSNQQFGYWTVIERDLTAFDKYHSVYWKCKCQCGTIKSIRSDTLVSGDTLSCGCIKFSKGEEKIKQILIDNNIKFETQKIFSTCKFVVPLRFDFYLPDYNTCIEYDGEQHFQNNNKGKFFQSNFELIQQRDLIKNNWTKQEQIKLIRIPYTHYQNISIQDLLPNTSKFII